jgi:hypothetical protein
MCAVIYSPNIVTNGLVLALDAANVRSYPGSGTSWFDLSGNGNTGTLQNTPSFDSSNNFFSFNNTSRRATISSPVGTSGFTTATVWYKRNESASASNWRTLLATTSTNIHHLISNSISRNLGIFDGSFKDFGYNPPTDGMMHNYTVVYQSTINASLYVDGNFISTVNTILNLQTSPIGSIGNWSSGNYWVGDIAQVQIYNRALTTAEITQNFNATRNRFGV